MPNEQILLSIEDSDSDFQLIKMAVRDWGPQWTVCRAYDGEQALEFLHRIGDYQGVPRPDLILLDAQLPKLNGFEVLEHLKHNSVLSTISVVMFTSLPDSPLVRKALALGAHAVIQKPVRFEEFRQQLQDVYRKHLEALAAMA